MMLNTSERLQLFVFLNTSDKADDCCEPYAGSNTYADKGTRDNHHSKLTLLDERSTKSKTVHHAAGTSPFSPVHFAKGTEEVAYFPLLPVQSWEGGAEPDDLNEPLSDAVGRAALREALHAAAQVLVSKASKLKDMDDMRGIGCG